MKTEGSPERKFNDRETISEPIGDAPLRALPRDPVVALRFHGRRGEIPLSRDKQLFSVGAYKRCDVVVDDRYVSSEHCVLERRDLHRIIVRDLASKNGTFINGNRIERAELRAGSLLTLGKTTLVAVGSREQGHVTAFERLRGNDPVFREAIDLAITGASSSCSILIVGETGTGKELVARAVHEASPRSERPFVAINCGAIPRELIGSELFGHEKGSFTGAMARHEGVFMRANGGTLFLDEIGELPLEQQPHLLRVLETRRVRRVGGYDDMPVDIRIVAATNQLTGLGTQTGELRPDLYHRIATIVVSLPPLRDRPADIPLLVRGFMHELAKRHGPRQISRETLRILQGYSWPGNVRELRHAVERAVALCTDELTAAKLLPQRLGKQPAVRPTRAPTIDLSPASGEPADVAAQPATRTDAHLRTRRRARRETAPNRLRPQPDPATDNEALPPVAVASEPLTAMEELLRDAMLLELERHGSIRKAAEALGMPKSTFADRARRYGIKTR